MEIIKRYVYAVTKNLPEKQRHDVARELESDIEAMVNDRASGKKATEKHIRLVLEELGDPAVFARQYNDGQRYLISPVNFDIYLTLLKTLLSVVLPIIAVVVFVAGVIAAQPLDKLIIGPIGAAIQVGVHIFFWVTIIFVILERSGVKDFSHQYAQGAGTSWTPDDLPQLPEGRRIPKSEAINGIVWSIVALLWVLWQVPSIHALLPLRDVPMFFSSQMWPYWITGLIVITLAALAVEIVRLVVGVWNKITVWLITIVNSALILFMIALVVFVRPIMNESFVQEVIRATENPGMMSVVNVAGVALAVSIVLTCVWEIGTAWYKFKKVEE